MHAVFFLPWDGLDCLAYSQKFPIYIHQRDLFETGRNPPRNLARELNHSNPNSNRGLFKAELVALPPNRSSRELHYPYNSSVGIQNSNCFIFERSPSASNLVFGTLQSFSCNAMQCGSTRGGDLGGTGGTVPLKFEVGDGPFIRPPNILSSSVVRCARKYEQSKERCFSYEERVIYDI